MKHDAFHIDIQGDCKEYSIFNEGDPVFGLAYETLESGTSPILHKYSRFWYFKHGRGTFRIQGKIMELSEGQLVGVLPWQCTEVLAVQEKLEYYIIVYDHDIINRLIKNSIKLLNGNIDFSSIIHSNVYVNLNEAERMHLDSIILNMSLEKEGIEDSDQDLRTLKLFSISNLLTQLIIQFYKSATSIQQENKYQNHRLGNNIEIFHYIYYNLDKKMTLKDLAKRYYMSESAISKYIFDTIGVSYSQLISTMKITKLMNFLQYSDNTLQEIAVLLGYVDAAHVSNFFKSKTGVNTKKYREMIQKNNKFSKDYSGEFIQKLLNYILEHYHQDLTQELISEKFGIPKDAVNLLFEYYVEKHFYDFVNFVRVIKAAEQLLLTDKRITEIAYQVGFNTTKTFNRNFYKIYNLSPLEFRKQMKFQASPL